MKIIAKDKVYPELTNERWEQLLQEGHESVLRFPVSSVSYDEKNDKIIFNMKNGTAKEINVYDIEELRTASKSDLKDIWFSVSGIHVEKLDVDISIEGLMKDKGLM